MYYLQSRYYDPALCRFINSDAYASTGQGFIGANMFAYCGNNPAAFADVSGDFPVLRTIAVNDGGSRFTRYAASPSPAYDQYVGRYESYDNYYSNIMYAGYSRLNFDEGVTLVDAGLGIASIGYQGDTFSWQMETVTASVRLGATHEFAGLDIGGSLISGGVGVTIPSSYTDRALRFGFEGHMLGLGIDVSFNKEAGELRLGFCAIVGFTLVIGIDRK